MNDAQTRALIQKHEGLRLTPYKDSRGILTVGYGFNLETSSAPGDVEALGLDYASLQAGMAITQQQATSLFEVSYQRAIKSAYLCCVNFPDLPDDAAAALVDMAYNLGLPKLTGFQHMLAALEDGDYATAAKQAEASLWFAQVGERGTDDVALFNACVTT